jgi:hypothetical protein
MTTLLYKLPEVQFDFDDEDFTPDEQQQLYDLLGDSSGASCDAMMMRDAMLS